MIDDMHLAWLDATHADLRRIILSEDSLKRINKRCEETYVWHPDYGQWRFISGILVLEPDELAKNHDEWEGFEDMYNVLEAKDIRYKAKEKGAVGLAHFKTWNTPVKLFGRQYTTYKGVMFCEE